MKKATALLIVLLLLLQGMSVFAEVEKPDIASTSAFLIQEGTGRVMFEKNPDKKVYPASTTKVMTAMLAIEALDPAQSLTASETAVQIDRDGSNMGILAGEVLTVEELLYGLLVHSANDAANVLAEAVGGSIPAFVELMNRRAGELGMTGTHFQNAHGYHDPEHYTTARDMMALIVRAMENDLFRKIVATPTYEIQPTNKYQEVRNLSSNNALLNPLKGREYVYEGAQGVKTGHTSDAGYCLTSYAVRKGIGYFCVTMGAPVDETGNHSFMDTISLFDYVFKGFSMKTVADTNEIVSTRDVKWGRGNDQVVLSAKKPLEVLLPKQYDAAKLTQEIYTEEEIVAPVKKGDILGKLEYFYNGESVGSVDLIATRDISRSFLKMVFQTLWDVIFSVWVMAPLGMIVVILIIRNMIESKKQRIAREKRRQQVRRDFYNH